MISMESIEEEETRKNYPSLPSNYVSLAQLQERWLQQQNQQQQKQEEEKQEEKQAAEKHQEGRTMENQRPGKKRQDFYGNRRSNNGGERRIEGKRVYVARRVLDGNSPKKIGAEEVRNGVDGLEKKMKGKGKKKYCSSKKRMARVEGSLIGEDQLQKLSENWGISGCLSGKNGGEEGCSGKLEGNGDRNRGVEENVKEVVPENRGKEVNLVGMGGKCGGDEVFDEGVWRNNDDWGVVEGGVNVCMIEVLAGNDELEEEVPVARNGDDQARGVTQEVGNVCLVKVLQENEVQEDVSVGVGRTNGKGRSRGRHQKNDCNSGKWRVREDSKAQLELGKSNEVEEGVCIGEKERNGLCIGEKERNGYRKGQFRGGHQKKDSNSGKWRVPEDSMAQLELGKNGEVEEGVCIGEKERNGYQKGWIRRGIQVHQSKERTSGELGRYVRRDLQVLSLDDSREGNVTSRKGMQGERRGRYGKSRDGGLVWVKKGEISDTNAAQI